MNIRKGFLLLVMFFCNYVSVNADSLIDYDGCFYRIIGDDEVELVRCFSSQLDKFIESSGKIGVLPNGIIYRDKEYRLTSIGDSVFCNMPDFTLVVPHTIRNIGKGNDVQRVILNTQSQYVVSYGSMLVNLKENSIIWINSACKDVTVVQLPPKMHAFPEDFITRFPKMHTLISPNVEALSEEYGIIAKNDTIYMIVTDSWEWHSLQCDTVESVVADSRWNDMFIHNVKANFPNLKNISVKSDKDPENPSPYISVCGALCYKDTKSIALIPPRMIAETDTLVISHQNVEHIPTDFFTKFPTLKQVNIETSKDDKDIKVKDNRLYYKSTLVAEAPCPIVKKVYNVMESYPEFPGGMRALMEYLKKNLRYPKSCQQQKIQGRVIVQFMVEKDGSITEVQVLKSVHPEIDKEAVRCVNAMPKWKPGIQRDEPVRVRFTLPLTFRLNY